MRGLSLLGASLILAIAAATSASASSISPLICNSPGSTTASSSDTSINANSCTDYSYQEPNSQSSPSNNWLYGYYQGTLDPTSFAVMTQQVPSGTFGWWAVDFYHLWTSMDAFGGHPNSVNTDLHQSPYCDPAFGGTGNCGIGPDTDPNHSAAFVTQWAVRRYVVPIGFNGMVMITVSMQKDYRTTGDRADGDMNYFYLYSGGTVTQLGSAVQVPTDMAALTGTSADPSTFPVQTVTFTIPVQGGDFLDFAIAPNSNDFSDGEFQLITIQAIPEPSTLLLVGGGLLLAGLVTRRRFARPF